MGDFFAALLVAREACVKVNGPRWDLCRSETMVVRLPPRLTGSRVKRRDFKIPRPRYWAVNPSTWLKEIEA